MFEKQTNDPDLRIGGIVIGSYSQNQMTQTPIPQLRRGWTTGACATAATKAALARLWGGAFAADVTITLPKGETPTFALEHTAAGDGWAEAGIIKDAGDDPDVTHMALIIVRVSKSDGGVVFRAGTGIGTVTKPGLPIGVGEPAINPVPRLMMDDVVAEAAAIYGQTPDVTITVSVPNGAELATKTWNPRLGIVGGLSILGTTGIVRPFSCAAWIASIHRGIDVARATGQDHVAGCTGATSERVVQGLHDLPDHAMLDMGDFAGGLLKYLVKHPVPRMTIGGGIGKLTKLAQGAIDLHSGRSQVDFTQLAAWTGQPDLADCNTALDAVTRYPALAQIVADRALAQINARFAGPHYDIVVIDRAGTVLARAGI
jgi:cobalt-precorrin-5B (C1)-methyltransferase